MPLIHKTYILSNSLLMSKQFIRQNPGPGYIAAGFKGFVTDLYNHPLFLAENEPVSIPDDYNKDLLMCRIQQRLSPDNYFRKAMNFMGNRQLIVRTLDELDLSFLQDDIKNFRLPDSAKEESLRELYRLYLDEKQASYPDIFNRVYGAVAEGQCDAILKSVQIILLEELELTGRETLLLELLQEKMAIQPVERPERDPDYSAVECTSSLSSEGNINRTFQWMKNNGLTSDNTVFATPDYDSFAIELYRLKEVIPCYLTRGLPCRYFSLFEQYLTELKDQSVLHWDREVFLDKLKEDLRRKLHNKNLSRLDKIFHAKVLGIMDDLTAAFRTYTELNVSVDIYELAVDRIENLRFSPSDLEMKESGFSLFSLDDIYALKQENISIFGLTHGHYPPKKTIDPVLKDAERMMIAGTIKGKINIAHHLENRLETLLANSSGKVLLSYESHDRNTGKLTVPSGFFNHILKSRGRPVKIDEIYDLCNVNESYRGDSAEQGEFLYTKTNKELEKNINQQQRKVYSQEIEDIDYGTHDKIRTRLSASSLEQFYKCPYAYLQKYLLKIEAPDLGETDNSFWLDAMTRGSFLHRLYELILKPFPGSSQNFGDYLDTIDPETIAKVLEEGLDSPCDGDLTFRHFNTDVPDHIKTRELQEIRENLSTFIEKEQESLDDFSPLAFEQEFDFSLEIEGTKLDFKGFIDRIDSDGKGRYRVIDYKTGGNSFSSDREYLFFIDGEGYKPDRFYFQHALYSKAINELEQFHPLTSVEAGYYFSTDRGEWRKVFHRGADPEKKLMEILAAYTREAKKGKYFKNAGQCRYCDYKPLCKGKQAQRQHIPFEQLEILKNTVRNPDAG